MRAREQRSRAVSALLRSSLLLAPLDRLPSLADDDTAEHVIEILPRHPEETVWSVDIWTDVNNAWAVRGQCVGNVQADYAVCGNRVWER